MVLVVPAVERRFEGGGGGEGEGRGRGGEGGGGGGGGEEGGRGTD